MICKKVRVAAKSIYKDEALAHGARSKSKVERHGYEIMTGVSRHEENLSDIDFYLILSSI